MIIQTFLFDVDPITGEQVPETWKPIPDYEGRYEASNCGRIRSIERDVPSTCNGSGIYHCPETILKQTVKDSGYLSVYLYKEGNAKYFRVSRLIMYAFEGKSTLQVDHKNRIKTDNRYSNLRYATPRKNVLHHHEGTVKTSKFPGVCWHKRSKKWYAQISTKGKKKFLGTFDDEGQAGEVYANELQKIA